MNGQYVCPTRCDDDCSSPCHEVHVLSYKRTHDLEACIDAKARARELGYERTPNGEYRKLTAKTRAAQAARDAASRAQILANSRRRSL